MSCPVPNRAQVPTRVGMDMTSLRDRSKALALSFGATRRFPSYLSVMLKGLGFRAGETQTHVTRLLTVQVAH